MYIFQIELRSIYGNYKFMKIVFLTVLFFLSNTSVSFAYIDPGTGSIILQGILAFIASVFAGASFYWHKIKLFIRSKFKKKKSEDS